MSSWPALVVDLGGTNLRLGLVDGPDAEPRAISDRLLANSGNLERAISAYLGETGTRARAAALAIAGPVVGDDVQPSNAAWRFSISALKRALGFERLVVVNDYHALALALPRLAAADLAPIGGGAAVADGPRVVIGPGTGLGVAALVRHRGAWLPVASEGGQAGFSPLDDIEVRVAAILAREGRVTVERMVCGPGLLAIDHALAEIEGGTSPRTRPEEVSAAASAGDARAARALDLFFAALGAVVGDAALYFCATGGVFLAGGILPRLLGALRASRFRARFEDKPLVAGLMRAIPTAVIIRPYPGLIGAAAALDKDNGYS